MPAAADAAPDLPTTPELAYDAFVAASYGQLREAGCRMAFSCPTQAEDGLEMWLGRYPDLETCLASEEPFDELRPRTRAGIAAGRIIFDASAALRCLGRGREIVDTSSDCAAYRRLDRSEALEASCAGLLRGAVAEGGRCAESQECASGTCDQDDATLDPDACYGICKARQGSCPQGCGADEVCASEGGVFTCLPKGARGEDCADSRSCLEGLVCDSRYDVAAERTIATCVALGSLDEGDACGVSAACEGGTSCDRRSDVCARLPLLAAGAPCRYLMTDARCTPGDTCAGFKPSGPDRFAGTCQPPRGAGEPCVSILECAGDLRCDGATRDADVEGTCQPLSEVGGPCVSFRDCADLMACRSGVCAAPDLCEVP
jgi:hypothetical protein